MDKLEIHTLICRKDCHWLYKTIKLFKHHSGLDFDLVVHEDGSLLDGDVSYLKQKIQNVQVIRRDVADFLIGNFLKNHPTCHHFRFAEHHTIFRIKLFDPFYFTRSHNVLYIDSDILFCKSPDFLLNLIKEKKGGYMRDSWSAYCVPFRDEDNNSDVDRFINAGLNYYPTEEHYCLDYVEEALLKMYEHGSRGATHPFLEQSCIAYMITKLRRNGISFEQLPHPDYCVPTFGNFIPEHGLTALHLNSSPLVGKWKMDHYLYELKKIDPDRVFIQI
jgi:hypothetical protein